MRRLHADFDRTFKALEDGLQVEHIAEFDLKSCHPEMTAMDVLDDPALAIYDQLPVRNSRGIIGVVVRPRNGGSVQPDARVEEVMSPLDSSMIVANSHPVASLLEVLRPMHFRLVVKGSEIAGIVTASDLLKLPVRLFAFMLVTHLEMLMAATIRKRYRDRPVEDWMSTLSSGRQSRILDKINSFASKNLDPDPIELSDFCDKREIIRRFHNPTGRFVNEMAEVEGLRNSLAHAATYLRTDEDIDTFLRRVKLTRQHIDYLQSQLEPHEF